jgi:Uma2 family endonuclease
MALTIQLQPTHEQTLFNVRRWHELLHSPELAKLPFRIETDRHGHILMCPPPALPHSEKQATIAALLKQLLPLGRTFTECPISTSDGVKATDVAWLSRERSREADTQSCFVRAPDICVEILSPSNTKREIQEKISLYFESGAQEVWVCDEKGAFHYRVRGRSSSRKLSSICPEFPKSL